MRVYIFRFYYLRNTKGCVYALDLESGLTQSPYISILFTNVPVHRSCHRVRAKYKGTNGVYSIQAGGSWVLKRRTIAGISGLLYHHKHRCIRIKTKTTRCNFSTLPKITFRTFRKKILFYFRSCEYSTMGHNCLQRMNRQW